MKEYETLTREKVDVVPFGCGMPETHLMQDWSDRMLDLILNGPTINGIKKDEVRAMLRETYTAGYAFATGLCVADFEERQLQINRAQSRRAGDDVSFQVLVQALDRKLGLVGCFDS